MGTEVNTATEYLVLVRTEPTGGFTAQAVGLSGLTATAATREEAIRLVQAGILEMLADGRLVAVSTVRVGPYHSGWAPRGPNDPLEKEFLEDLARSRGEDDAACSNSSSTPTT